MVNFKKDIKNYLLHKSIRFKITLGIVSILLLTILPFGLFQIKEQENILMNALKSKSMAIVNMVATNSVQPIESFDDLVLRDLVFETEQDKGVAFINILDNENELLVEDDYMKGDKLIEKKKKKVSSNILFLRSKIIKKEKDKDQILGFVEAGFYKNSIIIKITKNKWILSITLIFLSSVIVVILYIFLSTTYVTPILKLSKAALNLENEKLPIDTDKSDELGQLGKVFKNMRSTVNNQKSVLEKKVKEATETLQKTLNDTNSLLNNMKQGVFAIAEDGIIISPVSEYCANLFGESIIGKNIFDTLFKDLDHEGEEFSRIKFCIMSCIGSDHLQYICVENSFPKKITMINHENDECHLRLSFSPVVIENNITKKILLVVEDVTLLDELEKKSKESEEQSLIRLKMLQEIVSNSKNDLKNFINESNNNLDLCKTSMRLNDLNGFFRGIHTIKGLTNMYGLTKEAHLLENKVSDLIEMPTDENLLPDILLGLIDRLKASISQYVELYKEIFEFEKRKDSEEVELIEIPKDRFLFAREKVLEVLSQIPDKNYFTLIENLDKYELKQTFLSCKKIVDNLANVFGKHIQLEIKGDEFFLERDKALLLKESIVHIMQNS